MSEKFKNQYRIPSARWAAWDYGRNAAYFVTISTAQRVHNFGKVENGIVTLSVLGKTAQECWQEIPIHFPFVISDEFIIMPNHVHGIVVINKTVETQDFASLPETKSIDQFGPQSQNLASIIRGFKIGVTKIARQNNLPFAWQTRFYDRIIRNTSEHERIQNYIFQNPQLWAEDEFNTPTANRTP